jgi:hypothetical protein
MNQPLLKFALLVAATVLIPALALAERDHGRDSNDRGDHHERADRGGGAAHIPVVPETNAAWILIPFIGAVLAFSWHQLQKSKDDRNPG